MTIAIEITQTGKPALWEKGGCAQNVGRVTLVAGKYAEPCAPVFIKNEPIRNGQQALFLVRQDYIVIDVARENDRSAVRISKIVEFNLSTSTAVTEEITTLVFRGDDTKIKDEALIERYPKLQDAVTVAVNKSYILNCKVPCYFEERHDRKCRVKTSL